MCMCGGCRIVRGGGGGGGGGGDGGIAEEHEIGISQLERVRAYLWAGEELGVVPPKYVST